LANSLLSTFGAGAAGVPGADFASLAADAALGVDFASPAVDAALGVDFASPALAALGAAGAWTAGGFAGGGSSAGAAEYTPAASIKKQAADFILRAPNDAFVYAIDRRKRQTLGANGSTNVSQPAICARLVDPNWRENYCDLATSMCALCVTFGSLLE
jgi:hypothetical protein